MVEVAATSRIIVHTRVLEVMAINTRATVISTTAVATNRTVIISSIASNLHSHSTTQITAATPIIPRINSRKRTPHRHKRIISKATVTQMVQAHTKTAATAATTRVETVSKAAAAQKMQSPQLLLWLLTSSWHSQQRASYCHIASRFTQRFALILSDHQPSATARHQ